MGSNAGHPYCDETVREEEEEGAYDCLVFAYEEGVTLPIYM